MKRIPYLLLLSILLFQACNVTAPEDLEPSDELNCSSPSPQSGTLNKPTVTITLDDGVKTHEQFVLPILQNFNMTATSYVVSNAVGRSSYYMDQDDICALIESGWEIGAHTLNHEDMTELSTDSVIINLEEPKEYLESKFGIDVHAFASPYGLFNNEVIKEVEPRYTTHVNAFSDKNGVNDIRELDPLNIHRFDVTFNTPVEIVCNQVQSLTSNEWYVLIFHNVRPLVDDPVIRQWDNTTEKFERIVRCIDESDVDVRNVTEMYNLIQEKYPNNIAPTDVDYNEYNTLPDSISNKYTKFHE